MLSGRIFRFIGFNGTENGHKVCTHVPKKLMIGRIFVKVIFGAPEASMQLFRFIFFVISIFSVPRKAGLAQSNSKSNTVSGKSSF